MKKLLKTLLGIIIFLLGIIILFMLTDTLLRAFSPSDELTVSARFRIPVEKSDRNYEYYMRQDNGFKTVLVSPVDKIKIAEGAHDAPYQPAKMKNGVIRKGFEYGPDAIQGIIRKEDILKVWPETTLDGDWPFVVYFYNTSTGHALRMYAECQPVDAVHVFLLQPGNLPPVPAVQICQPGCEGCSGSFR